MLVLDSYYYKCHISASIKKAVQNTNTIMAVVPGGCTKLVQPADVSWNAPSRLHIASYTTHGWPVAPWSGHVVATYVHLQKHLVGMGSGSLGLNQARNNLRHVVSQQVTITYTLRQTSWSSQSSLPSAAAMASI